MNPYIIHLSPEQGFPQPPKAAETLPFLEFISADMAYSVRRGKRFQAWQHALPKKTIYSPHDLDCDAMTRALAESNKRYFLRRCNKITALYVTQLAYFPQIPVEELSWAARSNIYFADPLLAPLISAVTQYFRVPEGRALVPYFLGVDDVYWFLRKIDTPTFKWHAVFAQRYIALHNALVGLLDTHEQINAPLILPPVLRPPLLTLADFELYPTDPLTNIAIVAEKALRRQNHSPRTHTRPFLQKSTGTSTSFTRKRKDKHPVTREYFPNGQFSKIRFFHDHLHLHLLPTPQLLAAAQLMTTYTTPVLAKTLNCSENKVYDGFNSAPHQHFEPTKVRSQVLALLESMRTGFIPTAPAQTPQIPPQTHQILPLPPAQEPEPTTSPILATSAQGDKIISLLEQLLQHFPLQHSRPQKASPD